MGAAGVDRMLREACGTLRPTPWEFDANSCARIVLVRRVSGGRIAVIASPLHYLRSDRNPARTSSEKSCGCSQAAKWPPFSTLL